MNKEKDVVKVSIYGMEYPVKAGGDNKYVKSVAKHVDDVMLEIDRAMSSKSPLKVAVLAALNIADELMREREEKKKLLEIISTDAEKLIEKIDRKVQDLEK